MNPTEGLSFITQPMAEDALLTMPLEPTNEPYAIAKIAGIRVIRLSRLASETVVAVVSPGLNLLFPLFNRGFKSVSASIYPGFNYKVRR